MIQPEWDGSKGPRPWSQRIKNPLAGVLAKVKGAETPSKETEKDFSQKLHASAAFKSRARNLFRQKERSNSQRISTPAWLGLRRDVEAPAEAPEKEKKADGTPSQDSLGERERVPSRERRKSPTYTKRSLSNVHPSPLSVNSMGTEQGQLRFSYADLDLNGEDFARSSSMGALQNRGNAGSSWTPRLESNVSPSAEGLEGRQGSTVELTSAPSQISVVTMSSDNTKDSDHPDYELPEDGGDELGVSIEAVNRKLKATFSPIPVRGDSMEPMDEVDSARISETQVTTEGASTKWMSTPAKPSARGETGDLATLSKSASRRKKQRPGQLTSFCIDRKDSSVFRRTGAAPDDMCRNSDTAVLMDLATSRSFTEGSSHCVVSGPLSISSNNMASGLNTSSKSIHSNQDNDGEGEAEACTDAYSQYMSMKKKSFTRMFQNCRSRVSTAREVPSISGSVFRALMSGQNMNEGDSDEEEIYEEIIDDSTPFDTVLLLSNRNSTSIRSESYGV